MNKAGERLYNGLIKENPTFVLMLGMCPTLAVTTSAINGMGMGLTTAVVLALSNMIISLLRNIIPNRVRIPAFIVIIASFVTVVQLLLEAFLPDLNTALGVYIPLIVVNCIILGRAESYAYFNPPIPSLFDGIGMGLGFTFALTCIGAVREILGEGTVFSYRIMPDGYTPILIFVMAPGAFFVLAALTAFQNYLKITRERAGKEYKQIQSGCSEDCMNCSDKGCAKRFYDVDAPIEKEEKGVAAKTGNAEISAEVKAEKEAKSVEADVAMTEADVVNTEAADKQADNTEEQESKPAEKKDKRKKSKKKKANPEKKEETAKDDIEVIDLEKEDK